MKSNNTRGVLYSCNFLLVPFILDCLITLYFTLNVQNYRARSQRFQDIYKVMYHVMMIV